MREFVDLKTIFKDEKLNSENYSIYYSVTSDEELNNLKSIHYSKPWYTEGLKSNFPYVTLFKNGNKVMMSDVPMEKITNKNFIDNANGDVLIFGLGIGLIIFPLLQDKNINTITVVEYDLGLIEMVGPIIKKHDVFNKVKIIYGDAFLSKDKIENKLFDTIYFDIWISIMADNFKEMEYLRLMYKDKLNTLNEKSFMDFWCYEYCKKINWQTSEFIISLKKQFPKSTIDVEKEVLFIDGEPMNHLTINDSFLNSRHRFD